MSAPRRLWIGPPSAGLRDRLIEALEDSPPSIWITPTRLACAQLRGLLAARRGGAVSRVLSWDDLWRWVRQQSDGGPAWLSATAARAVLSEAVARARSRGLLEPLEPFVELPGYRRQLHARFQTWTRAERQPPAAASPIEAAERRLLSLYRGVLAELDAEDDAGAAVWASRRLTEASRLWKSLLGEGALVLLDLDEPSPAEWRVLRLAARSGRPVHVTLSDDPDPALAEVFLSAGSTRSKLRDLGFEETWLAPPAERPAGLVQAERLVFARLDDPAQIHDPAGLAIQGAPQGEGTSRLIAQAVRRHVQEGVAAEEILVLVPRWGAEAEMIRETLTAWGFEVATETTRSLRAEPSLAALLLAASIPLEDWATDRIVRLLRHGQVRPPWPGTDRAGLADAAAAIRSTPVFRGREQLLRALDRAASDESLVPSDRERAARARRVVDRLFDVLAPLQEARAWPDQVDALRRLAGALGIEQEGSSVLEPLWDALDDQADILERLGQAQAPWSWADTIDEVEAIVAEVSAVPPPAAPGAIRLATVAEALGARAEHVILADLAEGAFPARSAVRAFLRLRSGDVPDRAGRAAFAREMARFLEVMGSARSGILMVYPTADAKGQELLRAGFLDDLIAKLAPGAKEVCHQAIARFHPALIDDPGLAGSDADRRVRALALAAERGELDELKRLAVDPRHRQALRATAAALHAQQQRRRGAPFGEYDGLIRDGAAIREIEDHFGPDEPFSPSQLETYLSCPFQFFCKYVLRLKVIEDRDELEEDPTERGSQLHRFLQNFETLVHQQPEEQSLDEIAEIALASLMDQEPVSATDVEVGLRELERERIRRTVGQYLVQRRAYQGGGMPPFSPARLELDFGGADPDHPVLELSQGGRRVRLCGKIDRIDVAETDDGPRFRVIDYKSGAVPALTEVKRGMMLQLLVYAMAVERILYPDGRAKLFDVGYWSLRRDGFKAISFATWDQDQATLVEHVLALVDRLRRGEFVVQSQKDGCEGYCDFRSVCRVRQVRRAGKRHPLPLPTFTAQSPRRKGAAGREEPA